MEILFRGSIIFQIGVPECERSGIGVAEDGFGLRGARREWSLSGDKGHVIRAFDEKMVFVAGLAAVEGNLLPTGSLVSGANIERAGHTHQWKRDVIPGMIGEAEFTGALRREQEHGLDALVGKVRGRVAGEIDERAGDSVGGESTHRMTAYTDTGGVHFARERRDAFLQLRQGIQDKRDIERAAFPEGWFFEGFADGLQKLDIFLAEVAALDCGVIVRGLEGDVAIAGPVVGQGVAASLRAAGAMRKDDHGIISWFVGVENAEMKIFVALGVVEDDVGNFRDRVGTGGKLVAGRSAGIRGSGAHS